MKSVLSSSIVAYAILLASSAFAADNLTDAKGMTLYVFDKDMKGVPTCYDACAKNWPPYLMKEGAMNGEGWTSANRTDGGVQWVYDGKPVYYFHNDMAPGDAKGDGTGGVWHKAVK
jgi:predicted lipoprotein with Yx(FWY)xxD motif